MSYRRTGRVAVVSLAAIAVMAGSLAACDSEGEDRPNVDVIEGGGGTGSVSGIEPPVTLGASYEPSTDQTLNLAIGLDLRDMRTAMASPGQAAAVDWAPALGIYDEGKNQHLPGGELRTLTSLAGEATVDAFPGATEVYGREDFLDGMIRDALNGEGRTAGLSDASRRQVADKGVQVVMYGLALRDIGDARELVEGGDDGANVAIDQAWATIAGAPDENGSHNNGLLATALRFEQDFNLLGKIEAPITVSLDDALEAIEDGDGAAFEAAVADAEAHLNTIFYLGTLRLARIAELDARTSDREAHLAEGWTFFQAIRALVHSASPDAAATIEQAFTRDAAEAFPPETTDQIYAALNEASVLTALGIPASLQQQPPSRQAP